MAIYLPRLDACEGTQPKTNLSPDATQSDLFSNVLIEADCSRRPIPTANCSMVAPQPEWVTSLVVTQIENAADVAARSLGPQPEGFETCHQQSKKHPMRASVAERPPWAIDSSRRPSPVRFAPTQTKNGRHPRLGAGRYGRLHVGESVRRLCSASAIAAADSPPVTRR